MSVKGPLEKVDEDHCSVSSPLSEATSPQPIRATVYSIEVLLFDGMISNATVFESVDLDDKFMGSFFGGSRSSLKLLSKTGTCCHPWEHGALVSL